MKPNISAIPEWLRRGTVRSTTTGQPIGQALLRDDGIVQCDFWCIPTGYQVQYVTDQHGNIERLL